MKKDYEVYLAGRIANLTYEEALDVRTVVLKKLTEAGIKCRTPMRGKQHLEGSRKISSESFKNGMSIREVIHRDLNDLRAVDAVLILTGDDASWGTAGEFYYCTWIIDKPTLVIAQNYVGGWMEYYATRMVENIDEAVEVLKYWKKYWNGSGVYETR